MNVARISVICLLTLLASSAFADRGGVIFYNGFENGPNAMYAAGSPVAKIGGAAPLFRDGRNGKALVSGDSSGYLVYATDRNVLSERGSMEFWFCPVNWNGDDDKFHIFFETKGKASLILYKYYRPKDLSGVFLASPSPEPQFTPESVIDMTGVKVGEWHHFAATWCPNEIRVYLDGKAAKPDRLFIRKLAALGTYFTFGDRSWIPRAGCDTLLDDLYIYDRPLTETEVNWAYSNGQKRLPGDDIPANDAKKVWVNVTKLPLKGRIHCDVTASGYEKFTGKIWLEPSGKTLPATINMVGPGRGSADVLVKDLPAGDYKIRVEAKDPSGKTIGTYEEVFTSPGPAVWLGNNLGILKSVPEPWTAMKSSLNPDGAIINCWGRAYTLDKLGLPSVMVTQNNSILAGPVHLVAKVGGQDVVWTPGDCKITGNTDMDVQLAGSWQSSLGSLSWKCLTEFDGLMRYDLLLTPVSGATVSSMELRVPIQEKYASLYFSSLRTACTWGGRVRGATPAGTGVVYKKDWTPYWWFGNEDVGLAGFCTSDEAWDNGFRPDAFRIERSNGILEAVWSFNTTQKALDKPWKFTFGFQATPVKPIDNSMKWRSAAWNFAPKDEDLALPPSYWPVNSAYNNYFTLWPTQPYIKYYGYTQATDDAKFQKAVDSVHARNMMAVFYSLITGMPSNTPEGSYYRHEWTNDRIEPAGHGDMTGYAGIFGTSPSEGYIDYIVWKNYNFMKKFNLDGLYHDWTGLWPSANTNAGFGYVRDGVVRWEYPIFDLRELYKRVYFMIRQYEKETGKPCVMIGHMSGHNIIPVLSFVDIALDGEDMKPNPGSDPSKNHYLDVLPLDTFRAQFMSRNSGVTKILLPETISRDRNEYNTRNIAGLVLAHDVGLYGAWMHNPTIAGIYNTLDKFGMIGDEFYPYWSNSGMVGGQGESVICSVYKKSDAGSSLLVIYNTTKDPVTRNLTLNLSKLCERIAPSVTDAETGQQMSMNGTVLTVTLKPGDFRLIAVK